MAIQIIPDGRLDFKRAERHERYTSVFSKGATRLQLALVCMLRQDRRLHQIGN